MALQHAGEADNIKRRDEARVMFSALDNRALVNQKIDDITNDCQPYQDEEENKELESCPLKTDNYSVSAVF